MSHLHVRPELVDAVTTRLRSGGTVCVVLGSAGLGKSTLAHTVAGRLESAGQLVVRARASESETGIQFAALHQALRPLLGDAASLVHRQREALEHALALSGVTAAPDPLTLRVACLTLLSLRAARQPVTVVLDDAHWADSESLGVLEFAARRIEGESFSLLFLGRSSPQLTRLEGCAGAVDELRPLPADMAERLLDAQPEPPSGVRRTFVLSQSAGNPLALVELSAHHRPEEPESLSTLLPLPERLARSFGRASEELPAPARFALLVAAALDAPEVDGPALAAALALAPNNVADDDGSALGDLRAAVGAGLLVGEPGRLGFRHPTLRSVVYQAATPENRRAAHAFLVTYLSGQPERVLTHLAAAAVAPDAAARDALHAVAAHLETLGRHGAASTGFALAAGLSPDPGGDAADLLLRAAGRAAADSDSGRALEYARRACEHRDDETSRAAVALFEAEELARAGRPARAAALLVETLSRWTPRAHPVAGDPAVPAALLADLADLATSSLAHLGDAAEAAAARHVWNQVRPATVSPRDTLVELWQELLADRPTDPRPLETRLARLTDADPREATGTAETTRATGVPDATGAVDAAGATGVLNTNGAVGVPTVSLAAVAAQLDRTALARRLLDTALDRARVAGVPPDRQARVIALSAWARVDQGRWDEALEAVHAGEELVEKRPDPMLFAAVSSAHAYIAASRAGRHNVRAFVADTFRSVDPQQARVYATRARHALGVAAIVADDHRTAWTILSELFDGSHHPRESAYALADLGEVARRIGSVPQGRRLLDAALSHHGGPVTPRLNALVEHARAHLAAASSAESHFRASLDNGVSAAWPYERARAQLSYARWLRGQGRDADALPLLELAMPAFGAAGAKNWLAITQNEIRSAGGVVALAAYDALATVTPAERAVVLLVGEGLSNQAIADRLYLSPRTVESHLYHAYPKIGVRTRSELQKLLAG
ncbi:AAA family ATPase [Kineosporia sp. J2-2]|uniref:AAA family ATPase n=1 Tax=Kineosporia corallincola TaxID=2835133 RepID=A0ABS5TC11_9ACTN|nr:LuxR family transcriptional regulator [Kineosporia corallincola]MBT0768616.1 AAA family ATPase [Kineosporia corallincola]